MNIFVLDEDPIKAAEYHADTHCIKMILETAQMLCTTHHIVGDLKPPYKKTHENHPCNKWIRQSIDNYNWLCTLGLALCKEYTRRYNKIHKTQDVINWCINNKPDLPNIGLTPFAIVMEDNYKTGGVVDSYRNYYIENKLFERNVVKYKLNNMPVWLTSVIHTRYPGNKFYICHNSRALNRPMKPGAKPKKATTRTVNG